MDSIRKITFPVKISFIKMELISKIKAILFPIDKIQAVFIYGSFLDSKKYNDLDIAVFMYNDLDINFSYETLLEKKVQKAINEKVDLRIANKAPKSFLYEIFKGYCLFDKDDKIGDLIESVSILQMDQNYYDKMFLRELLND